MGAIKSRCHYRNRPEMFGLAKLGSDARSHSVSKHLSEIGFANASASQSNLRSLGEEKKKKLRTQRDEEILFPRSLRFK